MRSTGGKETSVDRRRVGKKAGWNPRKLRDQLESQNRRSRVFESKSPHPRHSIHNTTRPRTSGARVQHRDRSSAKSSVKRRNQKGGKEEKPVGNRLVNGSWMSRRRQANQFERSQFDAVKLREWMYTYRIEDAETGYGSWKYVFVVSTR